MRTVQTIANQDGTQTYKVRFRHPTNLSPTTGKPTQTSEAFSVKADAERFAKWLDALGTTEALERLYALDQPSDIPNLDTVAADHIRLLTGIVHEPPPTDSVGGGSCRVFWSVSEVGMSGLPPT